MADYRCNLCWASYDAPVALLAHEVDEEGRDFAAGFYAPSTAAATQ